MTAGEVLLELEQLAVAYGPAVVDVVSKIIADLRERHPEIGPPPPADDAAKIDAEIDDEIARKAPKGAA